MKKIQKIKKEIDFGGKKLVLTSGNIAFQATGAVMAQYGETVVLAAVVSSPLKEDLGYFPLSVEYQERLYAGGRIKGSRWVKREGRPSDEEILTGRLIDRSIRPLFPKEYSNNEVQVTITVLSVDMENSPDIVSAIATSAALAASGIPWLGPVAVSRVGFKDGKFIINPLQSEQENSDLDLVVSTTKDSVIMIEAGAKQVSEEKILEGIEFAQEEGKKLIDFISEFAQEVNPNGQIKVEKQKNKSLLEKIDKEEGKQIEELLVKMAKKEIGYGEVDEYKFSLAEKFSEEDKKEVFACFDELTSLKFRKMVLSGKRPDGRKLDEIRELSIEVGVLPRTHGSAIFKRGHTQVLSITTLGSPSLEQLIETAEGEESKRYMHHYSMPPYSSGETGRVGFPSRREIGHGALAERALLPVIPPEDEFPYTIRVVSEVLSSNGSTSMASTCGSTLSLMDAGVPISDPVGGIAMGVIVESDKKFAVLTDIAGIEDGAGDMDFKVAGTKSGITALQLDVKTLKLTTHILSEALKQAKKARLEILDAMLKVIDKPRESLSVYAPKIKSFKIPQDKIGELIGPGGRVIRSLIAQTGAQIEVEDDGTVSITGATDESLQEAVSRVEQLVKEVKADEVYEGIVKRIEPFGAFIEILPGKEGMVHVSDMSVDYVRDPHDFLKLGDKVQVRVKGVDDLGRINLSMILDKTKEKQPGQNRDSYSRNRKSDNFRRQKGSSGPHFPTSRLLDGFEKKRY
ncbi:MAG: polyribonucleotide nucleotidyltransferase [Patescibacteria group bacterium]|nr:MAG: polyribonucleotide nucleotidyltransferase [Patescibacteria group bacterium]